ncbi:MAG: S1 RNA-binding domain-containing protein, partial [Holophagales bacterium]|nr:S1 RNA-binding domain-containing protein [Holophagales bacterium]
VRAGLEVGSVARGTVTALEPYGAFVDLGGLEGLVHVSQLSHRRVDHPSDLLEVGQELDVQVTALAKGKDGRDRVSLSVKALERDPWLDAMARYDEGSTHRGEVRRLESFGAFVELEAGVEGLLPIGELGGGRRLSHPREVLRVGQRLGVRVLALDPGKRRIRLGPVDEAEMAEAEPSVREALERHRAEGRGFGSMAHFFEKGRKR